MTATAQPGTAVVLRGGAAIIAEIKQPSLIEKLTALAPRGVEPAHYVAALELYFMSNMKLLACTPESVATGMLRVAQTGLDLGVSCDLLPFGDTCQFSPRYNGLIELALAAGARSVNADVVREGDDFEWSKGTTPFLRHQRKAKSSAKITYAYAIAELKPGSYVFEVLPIEDIEATRKKYSKQWKGDTIESIPWYARKTAVRRIAPYLPKNPRFAAALQLADEAEEVLVDTSTGEIIGKATEIKAPPPATPEAPAIEAQAAAEPSLLTLRQRRLMFARSNAAKLTEPELREVLKAVTGQDSTKKVTPEALQDVLDAIDARGQAKLEAVAESDEADDDLPF